MSLKIKMGNGSVAEFASVQALGAFYGEMADAFVRGAGNRTGYEVDKMLAKAEAYSAVSWQLQNAVID